MTDSQKSRDDIEAELSETREHLAETVQAIQHKLDVKTRVTTRARRVRAEHGRELVAAGLAGVGITLAVVLLRRRRR